MPTYPAASAGGGSSTPDNSTTTTGSLGTPIAGNSGAVYFINGTVTGTLPAVGSGVYLEYTFVVLSGTLTLTAPSGGTITLEGTTGATTGTMTSSGIASATLVGRAGTSTWFSKHGISGTWNLS